MIKLKNLIKKIIKTDKVLDKQTPIFLLSILVLVLRIPNLFEPYWYGDEGIYLTIGQSLNKGAKLYSEIIDHKTPIIYYLARVQTQLNFRLLNIGWMIFTTIAFYYFAKKLFKSVKQTTLATFIFIIFTSLPWLEGNIPNGELFVLGFVMTGAIIISNTDYFKDFLKSNLKIKANWHSVLKNSINLITAGFFLGLGILTKIPAILDLAVFFTIGYFTFTNNLLVNSFSNNLKLLGKKIVEIGLLSLGVLIPILISIIYFVSIGSGQEYLDFGLLYNFRYASSWQLPFSNQLLIFAFTLHGKFIILTGIILFITLLKKYFKPHVQFILSWFGLSLFASLLSNRPYPHYFIQLVPPLSLLLTLIIKNKFLILKNFLKSKRPEINVIFLNLFTESFLLVGFIVVMILLNFAPYSTSKYYLNWYKLVTNKINNQEYRQTFDYLMTDNYLAAEIIKASGSKNMFIWGTNPMLYALTQTQPTGRFTVSFHIKDFDAFGETVRDVIKKEPTFIVVMKNEDNNFPIFKSYLNQYYLPNNLQFEHFTLWKRKYDSHNN
ncbi:MAG: hypothetical protein H6772_01200 [Pseudomonadales bacterium]|nr:hypothetical protein [Pseudomonadales bacterium]